MHGAQPLQAQADEAGQCVVRCAFFCIACRALVQPELAVAAPGGHADDAVVAFDLLDAAAHLAIGRSEEHTSELQSHSDLVCRLLLEKKKKRKQTTLHLL